MSNLERFPEAMRDDVRTVLLKFGSPELVHVFLHSDVLRRKARSEMISLLGDVSVPGVDQNCEPTPETFWFENMMDFACDHIAVPDSAPSGLDTYKPGMRRPPGTDGFLERMMLTAYPIGFDGHYEGIVGRPGEAVLRGALDAEGGWVSEVDTPERPGLEVSEREVRGEWEVADGGRLTGRFVPNPAYRPSRYASCVLRWFPDDTRPVVDEFARRVGSPELSEALRHGRWLSGPLREELEWVLDLAASDPVDPGVAAWWGWILEFLRERWPGDERPLEPHGFYSDAVDFTVGRPRRVQLAEAYFRLPPREVSGDEPLRS